MTVPTRTPYERLGGAPAVASMVDEFYERVLADPELQPFFADASMDRLRRMQREFFSAALGGPIDYSGLSLSHAHFGRGIERRHFARFTEHLLVVLEAHGLPDADAAEVIARVNVYSSDILGGQGLDG